MSINSTTIQSNALTIDGINAVTKATNNLNTLLSNSINNVTNNITSLYLTSQNYIIPSVQITNFTNNQTNTVNNDGYLALGSSLYNVPCLGTSFTSDGQSNVLLTCSDNNIDLSPLIQNNLLGNDPGLLTIQAFTTANDTYDCYYRDVNHFTFCKTALFPNYYGNGTGLQNDYGSTGLPPYGAPAFAFGVYGVWFQYQFSTAFTATSVIISVADYTQSPDWVFIFGNNDATFSTGWSFLGTSRYQFNALSQINSYQLNSPGSYLYYRVVVVSANNTQFSISGLKFATNSETSKGASFGTNASSIVNVGNSSNSTIINGNSSVSIIGSSSVMIAAPNITFCASIANGITPTGTPTISGLIIPKQIVLDCSRSEGTNLTVSGANALYSWFNTYNAKTIVQLSASVYGAPAGSNLIISLRVYPNSSGSFTATTLTITPTSLVAFASLNTTIQPDTFNGSSFIYGGRITVFITQVGSTSPGTGLKITLTYI